MGRVSFHFSLILFISCGVLHLTKSQLQEILNDFIPIPAMEVQELNPSLMMVANIQSCYSTCISNLCSSFNYNSATTECNVYESNDRNDPGNGKFLNCNEPDSVCSPDWTYYEWKSVNFRKIEQEMVQLRNLTYIDVDNTLDAFNEFLSILPSPAEDGSEANNTVTVGELELLITSIKSILEMNSLEEASLEKLEKFMNTATNLGSTLSQPSFVYLWKISQTNPSQPGSAGILDSAEGLGKYSSRRYMDFVGNDPMFNVKSQYISFWMMRTSAVRNAEDENNDGLHTRRENKLVPYLTESSKTSYISFSSEGNETVEDKEENLSATVYLPEPALENDSMLVNVRYKNLIESVPLRKSAESFSSGRRLRSSTLNSAIITTSIYPPPNTSIFTSDPVIITFHHIHEACGKVKTGVDGDIPSASTNKCETFRHSSEEENVEIEEKVLCVFWHHESPEYDGGAWSDDGCELLKTNSTHTVCKCSHLTSFAVLLQVTDLHITDEETYESHMKVLDIITNIGCSLSLIGVILMCAAFAKLKFHTENMKIHFNLGIAVGLADSIFLVERVGQFSKEGCIIITILLYYTNMSVLAWMLIEAIHLYSQVVVVFVSARRWLKYYLVTGWGFPILLLLVSASGLHWKLATDNVCWLSPSDGSIWAFAGPAVFVLLINTFILMAVVKVIINIRSAQSNSTYTKTMRTAVKGSVFLFPLLGTTWLFGLLAVSESTIVFQYLFASINSMQGFFLFVFHCLCNTEVRDGARRLRWFKLNYGDGNSSVKSRSTSASSLSPWCYRKYSVSSNGGGLTDSSRKSLSIDQCSTNEVLPAAKASQTSLLGRLSKIMPQYKKSLFNDIKVYPRDHNFASSIFSPPIKEDKEDATNKNHQLPRAEPYPTIYENKNLKKLLTQQISGGKEVNSLPKITEEDIERKMCQSYDSGLNSIENESILDEDDDAWMESHGIVVNQDEKDPKI